MANMTDEELRQLVLKRRAASGGRFTTNQTDARKEALQFYRGDNLDLYGDSGAGLSTVVSRDTMEAVESMLPGLVKPFVAGDETVRMEPRGPEDEDAARQATEYLNWRFSRDNNAFRVIYDAMKDGLLSRLGVAKVVHEEVEDYEVESYQGIDAIQVQALAADKSLEVLEPIIHDQETDLFDVKVQSLKPCTYYRVFIIAPDEFLHEERLASLDDATFLAHKSRKPVGDLIAMGLDKKKCERLKAADGGGLEREERFRGDTTEEQLDTDDLARVVDVLEAYIRCDYEKRGSLSWRKVWIGGEGNEAVLLSNEEIDDHPFVAWTPIPLPHKLVGLSIHDVTRDIQMQKTALMREMLNNMYLTNRPQREVVEGQVNIEDLLNPSVAGVVRVKQAGMIRDMVVPFVAEKAYGLIEYLDGVREQRTGSTRYNQGMDADSLNKTATGISIIQNASTQRAELVARQFAEFLRDVFKKLLALVSTHQDKAEVIRLRGEWVEIDPREWRNGFDMSVAVGLGTGNKDQMIAHLTNLLEIDKGIVELQQGANGPLLSMENIYEKLKRMVEAMGLKGIESYYTDPKNNGEQQQQPEQQADPNSDPAVIKARIDAEAKIEVATIGAEKDIIIAGLQPPPALTVGEAPEEAPQDAQEPQGEADGLHEPSYALGAIHGAQAASEQPDPGVMA
jgi:hypothetical protein